MGSTIQERLLNLLYPPHGDPPRCRKALKDARTWSVGRSIIFKTLSKVYDAHILSTPPWANPSAWTDKCEWVQNYMGASAYKRLVISHRKDLSRGDYLIDDRTANGAGQFKGEHIHFGTKKFPTWKNVLSYLL